MTKSDVNYFRLVAHKNYPYSFIKISGLKNRYQKSNITEADVNFFDINSGPEKIKQNQVKKNHANFPKHKFKRQLLLIFNFERPFDTCKCNFIKIYTPFIKHTNCLKKI